MDMEKSWGEKTPIWVYYFIIQILLGTASMNAAPSHLEHESGNKGALQAIAVCCRTQQLFHPGSKKGLVQKFRGYVQKRQ